MWYEIALDLSIFNSHLLHSGTWDISRNYKNYNSRISLRLFWILNQVASAAFVNQTWLFCWFWIPFAKSILKGYSKLADLSFLSYSCLFRFLPLLCIHKFTQPLSLSVFPPPPTFGVFCMVAGCLEAVCICMGETVDRDGIWHAGTRSKRSIWSHKNRRKPSSHPYKTPTDSRLPARLLHLLSSPLPPAFISSLHPRVPTSRPARLCDDAPW